MWDTFKPAKQLDYKKLSIYFPTDSLKNWKLVPKVNQYHCSHYNPVVLPIWMLGIGFSFKKGSINIVFKLTVLKLSFIWWVTPIVLELKLLWMQRWKKNLNKYNLQMFPLSRKGAFTRKNRVSWITIIIQVVSKVWFPTKKTEGSHASKESWNYMSAICQAVC